MDPDDALALRELAEQLDEFIPTLARLADGPPPTVADLAWPLLRLHELSATAIDIVFFRATSGSRPAPVGAMQTAAYANALVTGALAMMGSAVGSAALGAGSDDAVRTALTVCHREAIEASALLRQGPGLWPTTTGPAAASSAPGTTLDTTDGRTGAAILRSVTPEPHAPDPTPVPPPSAPASVPGNVVPLRRHR
ncbi:hypothetical protein [Streptacidiphilus sp. MAP5-52]|uniref:hypothetical protein n=1 Tax=Streptacidiphilus sp. MAP5-52 TaxID=3156267 RepID=UPI003517023D